jgi:fructuronate reductase
VTSVACSDVSMGARLTRAGNPRPVRAAHLGLGNFFRAHQAFYTETAPDHEEWGIAAFTGRRPEVAAVLNAQDNVYTLISRGRESDSHALVNSLSAAIPAGDYARWLDVMSSPAVQHLTVTITEQGYALDKVGRLAVGRPDVRADLSALRTDHHSPVVTAPARLAAGLVARFEADSGPLVILSCDNLRRNGETLRSETLEICHSISQRAGSWVECSVTFPNSLVDRITPRVTTEDVAGLQEITGLKDRCPVVCEPFSEWVIEGLHSDLLPRWDAVGVKFVKDVNPYESRKLRLLNAAHSLLAYASPLVGHANTVSEAVTHDLLRSYIEELWADAGASLTTDRDEMDSYQRAVMARLENPRVRHDLEQIALHGSDKLRERVIPIIREGERTPVRVGAARVLAAWAVYLRRIGPIADDDAGKVVDLFGARPMSEFLPHVLNLLHPSLSDDAALRGTVLALADELEAFQGG